MLRSEIYEREIAEDEYWENRSERKIAFHISLGKKIE